MYRRQKDNTSQHSMTIIPLAPFMICHFRPEFIYKYFNLLSISTYGSQIIYLYFKKFSIVIVTLLYWKCGCWHNTCTPPQKPKFCVDPVGPSNDKKFWSTYLWQALHMKFNRGYNSVRQRLQLIIPTLGLRKLWAVTCIVVHDAKLQNCYKWCVTNLLNHLQSCIHSSTIRQYIGKC